MNWLYYIFYRPICSIVSVTPRSINWRTVRKHFLITCPSCAACGSIKKLQVHHVVPFHIDETLELDFNNLICLCSSCHFLFGHFYNWTRFNPDVREDAAIWLKKMTIIN